MTGLIVSSIAGNRSLAPLLHHGAFKHQAKHFFYAAGWKKFEPLWDLMICARQLTRMTPLLEGVLSRVTRGSIDVKPEPAVAQEEQPLTQIVL